MAFPLRQSTASQEVPLGPFLDITDANTEETAITLSASEILVWKTGATSLVAKNSGDATHMQNGIFYAVLDATDTNTIGPLVIFARDTAALWVRLECVVYDEAVYDVLFGTTALSTYAGGAVASVTGAVASVTGNVGGNVTGSVGSVATGGITAASFGANAITAAKLDPDVTTELQNGLATAASLTTVEGKIDTLDTNVDTLLTRITSTLFSGITSLAEWLGLLAGKQTGNTTARTEIRATGAGSGTYDETTDSLEAVRDQVVVVDGIVDDILLDTAVIGAAGAGLTEAGGTGDHLTAVPWNSAWDAEVQSEVQDAIEANHLDHLLAATYDPASKPGAADALLNELVENDGGVARYTANALEQAPTGGSAPTAAQIADAVWEEAIADHSGTAGSTAEQLAAAGAAGDPWATALPGAYTSGQAGKIVGDNLNATVGSRATQTSVDTIDDFLDTEVAAIKAKTDNLPAAPAATGDIPSAATVASQVRTELTTELGRIDAAVSTRSTVTTAQVNTEVDTALADVGLTTTITGRIDAAISTRSTLTQAQVATELSDALTVDVIADSIPADGSRPTIAQAAYMITQYLTERSVSGTTVTVRKPDGSTTLYTLSLNDATSPTSTTRNA